MFLYVSNPWESDHLASPLSVQYDKANMFSSPQPLPPRGIVGRSKCFDSLHILLRIKLRKYTRLVPIHLPRLTLQMGTFCPEAMHSFVVPRPPG